MASVYNVLNDYGVFTPEQLRDEGVNQVTTNPYWLIAVFNQKFPATFKRSRQVKVSYGGGSLIQGSSFNDNVPSGVDLLPKPLLIANDCASIEVMKSKASHLGTFNANLYPGKEYIKFIFPGDYVFVWMFNNKERFLDIAQKVKEKQACNNFSDGLKFYGKISSVREQVVQQPDGKRIGRYTISGTSFTELDATFYYESHLAYAPTGPATVFENLNLGLDKLLNVADAQGLIPNRAIVAFLDVFLGVGVKHNLGADDTGLTTTFGSEGDFAHITPQDVGSILGKSIKSNRVLKTADIFETVTGVQKYSQNQINLDTELDTSFTDQSEGVDSEPLIAAALNPDNTLTNDSRRDTGKDLMGRMAIQPPALTNKPLWSVLQEYLNPVSNEMYTCLRVNPLGQVVPTMIVRQLPFTTDLYNGTIPHVTKFSELPRWEVPKVLVKSSNIGRSDALRFNYVQIYGVTDTVSARGATEQIVAAPPTVDAMDIARSGLRPYITTVNCYASDTREGESRNGQNSFSGPSSWMELSSDFLMGQHMTMTGNLSCFGIQSPICPGDNIEWDNMLFHIESVSHSCSIAPDGQKHFETSLSLSHGVNIVQPDENPTATEEGLDLSEPETDDSDIAIYPKIRNEDANSTVLPKITTDGEQE